MRNDPGPAPGSHSATRCVRGGSEILKLLKEGGRLAHEETTRREKVHRAHRRTDRLGWPDDRTHRKCPAQEWAGLGHDQVGLKILSAKRRLIQIWKYQTAVLRVSQRRRIARLVVPGLEMSGFGGADTEQDPQDL